MIVVGPNVLLTDPSDPYVNGNNPVIGWHNILVPGMLSADEEDGEHPVTNLANPATFLRWQGLTAASQTIVAAVNTTEDIDYVGLAAHNLGSGQISVLVEGSTDNENSYGPLVGPVMLGDDSPAILRFDKGTFTHIRITLGAGNAIPRIATMYIGKLLVIQRRVYVGHTPITMGRVANIVNALSENANFLGTIQLGEHRQTGVRFIHLEPDWYRKNFDPFVKSGRARPFFWAWRPGDYPREVGYSWLTSDPRPENTLPNGFMAVELNMLGVA